MPVFHTRNISGRHAVLDEEESRHCIRVLRLGRGAPVRFTDGEGNLYEARIEEPDPLACRLQITHKKEKYLSRDYHLHIAIAPTKRSDRFEWFLEKSTEIGVDEITPLICEHSERKQIRKDRSNKILLSAMKQSGRACLPGLNDPASFMDLVRIPFSGRKLIAHCGADPENYAGRLGTEMRHWLVLIGPEGDFSDAELEFARNEHFSEISLGEAVYRTETAGIIACQIIAGLYMH